MDPASAIGVVGGAIQIAGLITRTVQGLHTLKGRFENADLTINSLIRELSTVKAAITQLHELAQYNANGIPEHPEYIDGLDVAVEGCTAVMDVLSEEVAQLGLLTEGEPSRPLGLRDRMRVAWSENIMRDHHQRLHSQVLALQLLLQACHCRTSSEQLELLRKTESRNIIKQVSDDTATLRTSMSSANSRIDDAASSIRGSSAGHTTFDFDRILVKEAPYRRVMGNTQLLNPERPAAVENALPQRNESNATRSTGTDEGYASGTAGSRTPNRSLSSYLNSTNHDDSLGVRPYEVLQTRGHDTLSRGHTVSFSSTSSTDKPNIVRGKSTTAVPPPKHTGSIRKNVRSALKRLNTASRVNLSVSKSPISGTSPPSGSMKKRRNRPSESNISIDLTSEDGIAAPPIVRAAQSGAVLEVKNFINNGADIETCDARTGLNALAVAAHCGKDDIVNLLINHNANVNVLDVHLSTPLHLAASRGHGRVLQLLLEDDDVDIDAKDSYGRTAFWIAANGGHVDASNVLLDNDCKINARAEEQMTALHVASKNGDLDMVSLLLRYGADIEAKDLHMMAAIHHASEGGHVSVVELLLNYKANIEAAGAHRMTPLICSAATGQLPTTQFLLRRKAVPRSTDEHGMNALHWAAFNGHTEVVELLLQKKIPIRTQNSQGRTALHLAAMNKQFAVVEFLLRRAAPLEIRCRQGFTPLHYACNSNNLDLVRLLIASGADVEAETDGRQHRPIHIAVSIGSLELTKLLCDKGVFVDAAGSASSRALCIACRNGNTEISHQLLKSGAKIRVTFADRAFKDSPLCIAAEEGHLELASLLLGHGSSPTEDDEAGYTPLLYAAHYGHPQVLDILLDRARLRSNSDFFDKFNEIGFYPSTQVSEANKGRVRQLIFWAKSGTLSATPTSGGIPRPQPSSTDQAVSPARQPNVSEPSSEPQDTTSTPAFAAPVALSSGLPLPTELPSTVRDGLPNPRVRDQERLSPLISPSPARASSPAPSLPLSSTLVPNSRSNPHPAILRSTALGHMATFTPSSSPSDTDTGDSLGSRQQVDVSRGAAKEDGVAQGGSSLSTVTTFSENGSNESRESIHDEEDEEGGISDTESIRTVFTAPEVPEESVVERFGVFELEG
ncbi:hypothetical protein FQN50_008663 [Emmonsiellopsis sp. PD_5]|nr:hypothetical protein FQN50_008663 [Emmonsiellopsis sp. PD_5]